MPYVKQSARDELDPLIEQLADAINELVDHATQRLGFSGLLNYCITRLAQLVTPERRYWALSLTRAAMQDAADEYYRRVVAKYEDEQKEMNGDVYGPTYRVPG